MTKYIFRLATTNDQPAIHRLQTELAAELAQPMSIDDAGDARGDCFVVEAAGADGRRTVGMMSLTRASARPFAFEEAFPKVWNDWALPVSTGKLDLQRCDLVELDWGYIEKPYRGQGFSVLLLAASLLHAHQRAYVACVAVAGEAALRKLPPGAFHPTGFVTHLSGVRYELGTFLPAELAAPMAALVHSARMRDSRIAWELPWRAAAPRWRGQAMRVVG
jgi:GNAT superfamily N-acetyltransferase